MTRPAKKRESASERDERLVRESGPWVSTDKNVCTLRREPFTRIEAVLVAKAITRLLNRIAAKGKKGAAYENDANAVGRIIPALCDQILAAHAAAVAEAVRMERERIAASWDDTESRAAEAHETYQREAYRRGDVRHEDAYSDLPEATKEWDRALVRWVAAAIREGGSS